MKIKKKISKRNFVNLNVNPCKMCMPLGAVMAFKGIEDNMVILHGSQGCSTYIRRHMATHYNEPIDIASSSLSEHGTVYGGADNLKTGLKNIIKSYNPQNIGVITTCLAETIGEDIKRIISEFKEENPEDKSIEKLKIIPVATPGYGATQSEGYYRALRGIVEQLTKKVKPHNKINIVAANLNPGDVRNIKYILKCFDVEYTLLPDVSNTLDAPYAKEYRKIQKGGTTLKEIEEMSGALATIEMGSTIEDVTSPGKYLEEEFGVPLYKIGIPIGIRNTDEFLDLISKISGKPIPEELTTERGRYLDAMIDAHKYNGEARAVIYGEPEMVLALSKLCFENGVLPVLIATGSQNDKIKAELSEDMKKVYDPILILDDTDFETIEKYAIQLKANLMIGNSDGRRVAEKLGINLIRIGFPVHDRVGAQRQIFTGYNGSTFLTDSIANSVLETKENTFRKEAYDKYYREDKKVEEKTMEACDCTNKIEEVKTLSIEEKTATHPCYNKNAHDYARMHIPVAPKCNISCNYCSRKYDCPNESRPGVTSEVLNPEQALAKYKEVKSKMPNLKVLGIAGPGDPLANFDEVKKSIQLIKEEDPEVTFCLSTNGLMLPFYANELVELGVSHVTITINTIDPKIGAKLYKEVNYLGKKLVGEEGAATLLNNQLAGLKFLTSKGIMCKVNIVMVKGINDEKIPDVVNTVKEAGAFVTNIMQMIPAPGSAFEDMPFVSNAELNEMRNKCEGTLKQMYHCKQCRADAIGTLANDRSIEFRGCGSKSGGCGSSKSNEEEKKEATKDYKFAIASKTGLNIDEHFGHAQEFYIYDYVGGDVKFVEKRNVEKYCSGIEDCDVHDDKIERIIKTIKDCNAVLALRAGDEPKRKLENKGIKLFQMYDGINSGIVKAAEQLSS